MRYHESRSCNLNIRHTKRCVKRKRVIAVARDRGILSLQNQMRTIASDENVYLRVSFRVRYDDDDVIMFASRVYIIDHSATIGGDISAPLQGFCLYSLCLM